MSATDRLCELLDERGVEYHQTTIENIASYLYVTTWDSPDGHFCEFHEIVDGEESTHRLVAVRGWELTPEQVIDMTLGRETCHPQGEWDRFSQMQKQRVRTCQCGEVLGCDVRDSFFGTRLAKLPNFCPNCGRRVIP